MSEHHFWTCPACGNQYTSKDVRDAHQASDCEAQPVAGEQVTPTTTEV